MQGDSTTASRKNRPALIVGSSGQDGFYLGQSLHNDAVEIVCVNRAGVARGGPPEPFSILAADAVGKLVAECRPSQIYYLAAHHRSAQDAPEGISESLENSYATHVRGLVHFLDAIRDECPESRLFYAASSHVFGDPATAPQNEETPFLPVNVYGVTKAAGIQLCRLYRRQHGLHCSAGILYNHESPRRSPAFVGRKIVQSAVAIKNGQMEKLTLGDLSAEIDWGSALDYVEAMRAILALDAPDDFVIASGELHSIGDFVDIAFGALALDPQKHIEVNPGLITKSGQARPLVGDASKLREATGWAPKMSFEEIILSMISAEQAA